MDPLAFSLFGLLHRSQQPIVHEMIGFATHFREGRELSTHCSLAIESIVDGCGGCVMMVVGGGWWDRDVIVRQKRLPTYKSGRQT